MKSLQLHDTKTLNNSNYSRIKVNRCAQYKLVEMEKLHKKRRLRFIPKVLAVRKCNVHFNAKAVEIEALPAFQEHLSFKVMVKGLRKLLNSLNYWKMLLYFFFPLIKPKTHLVGLAEELPSEAPKKPPNGAWVIRDGKLGWRASAQVEPRYSPQSLALTN